MWRSIALVGLLLAQTEEWQSLWEARDNPESAAKGIELLEKALSSQPHDMDKIVRLARLYYLLGEQSEKKEQRLERYDRAYKLCREELRHQLGLNAKASDEEIVKKTTAEHMPLLYWAGAAIARWGKHASFAQKVQARSTIRAYWDRILELQPDYFYGGAYRFFGGYYALVPAITGEQDVKKSREMFEKALAVAPDYLETKVLYAEAYAAHAKVRDVELFRRLLKEVQAADPGTNPEYAAENRLAKKKAEALLAREKELFED